MSKEAMEAVLANSQSKGGPRGVLLALAWRTYDKAPTFTGPFTVRYIATLANVAHRQAQADVAILKKLGELIQTGKQGREYVYGIDVALANYAVSDVVNYVPSDVETDHEDANYVPSDVVNYAVSDVVNYVPSDVLTTSHPTFGSYKETRNKREQEVTSAPPILENLRAQIAEAEQRAEQTPSPLPPSPDQARRLWASAVDILKTEMSDAQYDSWLARVAATWARDGVLRLGVRSSHAAEMLETRYSDRISAALLAVAGEPVKFIAVKG